VAPSGEFQFEAMQEIKFKNIMQPVLVGALVLQPQSDAANMHIDPVCHMLVDDSKAFNYTHNGKTYHFCSNQCMEIFIKDPAI
jgi:YHS domain-containing protein